MYDRGLYCLTVTFSCVLKFLIKDYDPNIGEADYGDDYVLCKLFIEDIRFFQHKKEQFMLAVLIFSIF